MTHIRIPIYNTLVHTSGVDDNAAQVDNRPPPCQKRPTLCEKEPTLYQETPTLCQKRPEFYVKRDLERRRNASLLSRMLCKIRSGHTVAYLL